MSVARKPKPDGPANTRRAVVYRMVTDGHVCPFGLKAVDLLRRKGFSVEDRHLTDRAEIDAFKSEWGVSTTPQVFLGSESAHTRIGGYDATRRHFGLSVADPEAKAYTPVAVVFAMGALMAVAAVWAQTGHPFTTRTIEWSVAFSMAMLAMLKLRDLRAFSNMFLNYDVLARRVVRYAYVYPFAEGFVAIAMIAGGALGRVAAPVALCVGTIGAWSVVKAVYVDRRDLKCACTGGGSNVPLGFVSLLENLAMMGMGVWMALGEVGARSVS